MWQELLAVSLVSRWSGRSGLCAVYTGRCVHNEFRRSTTAQLSIDVEGRNAYSRLPIGMKARMYSYICPMFLGPRLPFPSESHESPFSVFVPSFSVETRNSKTLRYLLPCQMPTFPFACQEKVHRLPMSLSADPSFVVLLHLSLSYLILCPSSSPSRSFDSLPFHSSFLPPSGCGITYLRCNIFWLCGLSPRLFTALLFFLSLHDGASQFLQFPICSAHPHPCPTHASSPAPYARPPVQVRSDLSVSCGSSRRSF